MDRLVIDTNSLIQMLPARSRFHDIWQSVLDGRNFLCVSNEILEEYEEILQRKFNSDLASIVIATIISNKYTKFITPYYHFNLIKEDPDDNKFVDCAVSGSARYIVSEDHHFSGLKKIDFPRVDVLTLEEALEEVSKSC